MPPLKISEPVAAPLHVYAAARSVHAHVYALSALCIAAASSRPSASRRLTGSRSACSTRFTTRSSRVGLRASSPARTSSCGCVPPSKAGLRPHLRLHTCARARGSPGSGVPEGEPRDGTDLRAQEHAVRQDERGREVRPVPRRQGPRVPQTHHMPHNAAYAAHALLLLHCSCCTPTTHAHRTPTTHAHHTRTTRAPHAHRTRAPRARTLHAPRRYASYNKPYSVMAWLEQTHVEEEMVLVMATRTRTLT